MTSRTQRLIIPPVAESLGEAREWIRVLLEMAGVDAAVIDDAQLVVTELLSNAMRHAEPPLELEVSLAGSDVVIEVADHSPDLLPRELPIDHSRIGGWGIGILSALSTSWGVRIFDDHKIVWVVLPATGAL